MNKIKKPLLFALCLLPIALLGGIFASLHQLDILSPAMIEQLLAELGSRELLIVIGALQAAGYALFCGFFGHILADQVGLWRQIRIERKSFLFILAISTLGGIVFSLDHWMFGSFIDGIQATNEASLTLNGVLASLLYGGILEEVMMRLFFMSLIAFVLWKLFFRKYEREAIPTCVFVIANLTAAILFAAGHLPATLSLFGELTPLLLVRCFLLNGGFALLFGWLFRKYGIVYAIISHATFHIVSKLIWILFI